jgi:DNA primase
MLTAARFYRTQLKDAPRAIEYLKGRGLTGAIAAKFGVGYAPEGWQSLAAAFPEYDDPGLETAGLVIAGDGGKRYDRFRDRIMFPIHDTRGQVIAFGGRVLGDGEPKYLNSPETPLFSKGRELYGLFLARNAIRDAGKVIVVEGYMDVVALAQHGVENVVATLGTATTPIHVHKLFRLTDTIVFCFDGDNAGRKAAWRALENTLPVLADGKNAVFLFLPEGEDPDDFVRKRGKVEFEDLIGRATPLSDFLLAELAAQHPPATTEGRAALVAAARPLLGTLTAPILGSLLRRRLAGLTGLPEDELRHLLKTPGGAMPRSADSTPTAPTRSTRRAAAPARRAPSLLRELIRGLLLQPEAGRSLDVSAPDDGTAEAATFAAVANFCRECESPLTTQGLLQHFAGSPHGPLLGELLAAVEDHALSAEQVDAQFRAAIARLADQARVRASAVLLETRLEDMTPEQREAVRRSFGSRPITGAERTQ